MNPRIIRLLNPWRRIRELEDEVRLLDHALHHSNERYDRIRQSNAELREALSLYRR